MTVVASFRDHYDSSLSLRQARQQYFEKYHFGDGGYSDAWVKIMLGPIPFWLPNTEARRRAVRLHDLHHVLTGYQADLTGESEISAWELASGCRGYVAAWVLNIGAMGIGLVIAPRRTLAAYQRGRRSENLYKGVFAESLLDERLGDMRRKLLIKSVS